MTHDQAKFIADMNIELVDLIRDLAAIGINYRIDGNRLEWSKNFDEAIPIVLDHLRRDYSLPAMMSLCGELICARPELKKYWEEVVDIYRGLKTSDTRYATDVDKRDTFQMFLANILIRSFSTKHLDTLIELIRDPANGETRLILLGPLRRRRKNETVQALLGELMSDPFFETELKRWKPAIPRA